MSSLVFKHNSNTTYWKIEVNVDTTVNDEVMTAVGSMVLKTNQPPYNGSCVVYNNTGEALSTNFSIVCSKWLDDDGYITQYEYWCK